MTERFIAIVVCAITFFLLGNWHGRRHVKPFFQRSRGCGHNMAELRTCHSCGEQKTTPAEYDAMIAEQRKSWARGQVGLIESDKEYARKRGLSGN